LLPVDRPFGTHALAPCPAARAPEFAYAIAGGLDESRELRIRHRRQGDAEWRNRDLVRPFLVVEHEAVGSRRAEPPAAARYADVAGPRPVAGRAGRIAEPVGPAVAVRLAHIGQGLDVHVLVPDSELIEIARRLADPAAQPVDLAVENIGHVAEHAVAVGQVEV